MSNNNLHFLFLFFGKGTEGMMNNDAVRRSCKSIWVALVLLLVFDFSSERGEDSLSKNCMRQWALTAQTLLNHQLKLGRLRMRFFAFSSDSDFDFTHVKSSQCRSSREEGGKSMEIKKM